MSDAEAEVPTIAIIDDDERVRITMSTLVRSLGFSAIPLSSAEEYLMSPHRYRPSCLISDVQRPGMSGLELYSRLAAEGHRVPIIFITAFPHPSVEKRARAAGAICVLNKPFESEVLSDCIQRALKAYKSG